MVILPSLSLYFCDWPIVNKEYKDNYKLVSKPRGCICNDITKYRMNLHIFIVALFLQYISASVSLPLASENEVVQLKLLVENLSQRLAKLEKNSLLHSEELSSFQKLIGGKQCLSSKIETEETYVDVFSL